VIVLDCLVLDDNSQCLPTFWIGDAGALSVPSLLGDETGEEGVLTLFRLPLKRPLTRFDALVATLTVGFFASFPSFFPPFLNGDAKVPSTDVLLFLGVASRAVLAI
jgi:hypothetical protein